MIKSDNSDGKDIGFVVHTPEGEEVLIYNIVLGHVDIEAEVVGWDGNTTTYPLRDLVATFKTSLPMMKLNEHLCIFRGQAITELSRLNDRIKELETDLLFANAKSNGDEIIYRDGRPIGVRIKNKE